MVAVFQFRNKLYAHALLSFFYGVRSLQVNTAYKYHQSIRRQHNNALFFKRLQEISAVTV